eukprot:1978676-Pyramimonas_sp.AAC.1
MHRADYALAAYAAGPSMPRAPAPAVAAGERALRAQRGLGSAMTAARTERPHCDKGVVGSAAQRARS